MAPALNPNNYIRTAPIEGTAVLLTKSSGALQESEKIGLLSC